MITTPLPPENGELHIKHGINGNLYYISTRNGVNDVVVHSHGFPVLNYRDEVVGDGFARRSGNTYQLFDHNLDLCLEISTQDKAKFISKLKYNEGRDQDKIVTFDIETREVKLDGVTTMAPSPYGVIKLL